MRFQKDIAIQNAYFYDREISFNVTGCQKEIFTTSMSKKYDGLRVESYISIRPSRSS